MTWKFPEFLVQVLLLKWFDGYKGFIQIFDADIDVFDRVDRNSGCGCGNRLVDMPTPFFIDFISV